MNPTAWYVRAIAFILIGTAFVVTASLPAGFLLFAFFEALDPNLFGDFVGFAVMFFFFAELVVVIVASTHYQQGIAIQKVERAQMFRSQKPVPDEGQQPAPDPTMVAAPARHRWPIRTSTLRNVLLLAGGAILVFGTTMVILTLIFG